MFGVVRVFLLFLVSTYWASQALRCRSATYLMLRRARFSLTVGAREVFSGEKR
jgi:hypothetical protein